MSAAKSLPAKEKIVKRGREVYQKTIALRLGDEDYATIDDIALMEGIAMGAVCRRIVMKYIRSLELPKESGSDGRGKPHTSTTRRRPGGLGKKFSEVVSQGDRANR